MPAEPDQPRVELDFRVHWCARHLEPYRSGWPGGAPLATVLLAGVAIEDELITKGLDVTDEHLVRKLNARLLQFAPLCCAIDPGELARIYAETGIDLSV